MTSTLDYAAFVAQAETAVKGVKDPELKRIAFQKVLEDLMGAGDRPSSPASRQPNRKTAANKTKPRAAKGGATAYIRELIEEAFFQKPKTIAEVKVELGNRGHHIPTTSLSGPLQSLCQSHELRRNRSKDKDGEKKTFAYSNW